MREDRKRKAGARRPYALPARPRAIHCVAEAIHGMAPSQVSCLGPAPSFPRLWGDHHLVPWIPAGQSGNYLAVAEGLPETGWLTIHTAPVQSSFMLRPHLAGKCLMLTGKSHGALHHAWLDLNGYSASYASSNSTISSLPMKQAYSQWSISIAVFDAGINVRMGK